MKSASNRAASKKAAPNKAAAGKVASKKGMGEKAWVTKHPSVGLEICPKIPGTSKRDERGAIVLLEEIAECASTVPDAKGFEDITFKGYSERAFGHWRKHILYNVEARLRNDKEYKGDPKLWVHPGSYRDIYKWAESQKQQYSDVRNSHNRTGSEAQSYVPKSALQKARDKVWRDNARCNFPSTCIETSCVPSSASQSTWGETPSKPHANSPLSATSDRNSDGLDTHGVGVTDLFGNGGAGDVESVNPWDLEPEEDDLSDGEAEKGFSQSSQPGSAGDKDGGGGGRSAIVDGGGVSSSGAAKGKVPSKGKGKAPGTTPPRSRGRHGYEKKQLETFRSHNLKGVGAGVAKAAESIASIGGHLEKAVQMIAGSAGGGAGAGVAKKTSKEDKLKLCMAFDQQYGTNRNQEKAQELLDELLSS